MKDDVYVGYEINSKKNEINLCNGVDCVHIVYTPWATSKQHRVFSPMFHAVSFCLVWNHTRIRTRSNSHLPECIKNSGSSIPFCTSTSAYYSITLHSFSNISPLFPFCTRSFFLSFFHSSRNLMVLMLTNAHSSTSTHVRARTRTVQIHFIFFVQAIWFFLSSLGVFWRCLFGTRAFIARISFVLLSFVYMRLTP